MSNLREVQPYETLKSALDDAHKNFDEALHNLTRNVNHEVGPLLLLMDIEAVFKAHAVVKACEDAFTREYTHMTEANNEMRAQRDEANRKFESFKRMLNSLNMDDNTTSSPTPPNKGRKRKK